MSLQCNACGEITLGPSEDENAAIQDMGWTCDACKSRKARIMHRALPPDELKRIEAALQNTLAETYAQGYAEGVAEGLILAAENKAGDQ